MSVRLLPLVFTAALLLSACSNQTKTTEELPANYRVSSSDLKLTLEIVSKLEQQLPSEDILVVFDIDNTLLAMNTQLGSDQWYDWQSSMQKADKCDPRLVRNRLASQGALFFAGSMRPTQSDAAAVVKKLQQQGTTVMAATARGWTFVLPTMRELRRNQMDFRATAPGPVNGYGEFQAASAVRPLLYKDGVYMLAGQHKGDMLIELLNKIGGKLPKAIVVIDDKDYNLAAYEETAKRLKLNLYSIYYTGVSDWVASFNPEKATTDWQQARPALEQLQAIFGNNNFKLPTTDSKLECE
ncbi:MAG: DUF2608 domain-containing protein [Xanthomonadales bacterium]|nr:DUF2608 domain-containing protein [Xanthomonadales bacterium]